MREFIVAFSAITGGCWTTGVLVDGVFGAGVRHLACEELGPWLTIRRLKALIEA